MTRINAQIAYFRADGRPTIEGEKFFNALAERLNALDAKLAVAAAVADPTGGGTVDTQARAAIVAIKAALS